jgi:hypothetical protein
MSTEERKELAKAIRPPSTFPDKDQFVESDEIRLLAQDLIATCPEIRHIQKTSVVYAWKAKGGMSGGKQRLGQAQKLTGVSYHFAEGAEFLIWLAADHLRERLSTSWSPLQTEALLFHELCHIDFHIDERPNSDTEGQMLFRLAEHDFTGFIPEIERYGFWSHDLRELIEPRATQLELEGFE